MLVYQQLRTRKSFSRHRYSVAVISWTGPKHRSSTSCSQRQTCIPVP